MEQKNFNSSCSAEISAVDATKKISNVTEWWGITFQETPKNKMTGSL